MDLKAQLDIIKNNPNLYRDGFFSKILTYNDDDDELNIF